MTKFNLEVDIELGQLTAEGFESLLRYELQEVLISRSLLINAVKVKHGQTKAAMGIGGQKGPGRKPINRPRIEAWIRANIVAAPSTQGTVGLEGVDRNGFPKDLPNRIFIHRLGLPIEEGGTGLSQPAITKVLGELEQEGYIERGFAAGAPFYELIRPLEEEGKVGVRGRSPEEYEALVQQQAKVLEIDFSKIEDIDDSEVD